MTTYLHVCEVEEPLEPGPPYRRDLFSFPSPLSLVQLHLIFAPDQSRLIPPILPLLQQCCMLTGLGTNVLSTEMFEATPSKLNHLFVFAKGPARDYTAELELLRGGHQSLSRLVTLNIRDGDAQGSKDGLRRLAEKCRGRGIKFALSVKE